MFVTSLPTNQDTAIASINATYYDGQARATTVTKSFSIIKNKRVRPFPSINVTPDLVVLTANYLGVVDTSQSKVVTYTVRSPADASFFTYDGTDAGTSKTFNLNVSASGGATITNNSDGTITVSNLPTNQDSGTVTVDVKYYDDEGTTYTDQLDIEVLKVKDARSVPTVLVTPTNATLTANYKGVVKSGQSETITFSVTSNVDGSSFTYDSTDAGTNETYFISVNAADGSSISNNADGTLSVSNIPTNQSHATVSVDVNYYDSEGVTYNTTHDFTVDKLLDPRELPDIDT